MEEVMLGILVVLAVIGGWVLGVVGFFASRRALGEVATLRRQLDALRAGAGAEQASPPTDPASIWVTPRGAAGTEPLSPAVELPESRSAEPPPFGVVANASPPELNEPTSPEPAPDTPPPAPPPATPPGTSKPSSPPNGASGWAPPRC